MTDNNGMAIVQHVNGTGLQPYRDRDEVRELGQRLLSLHPAAAEVGQSGMMALAQLALLIGVNPLPGVNELHVWKTGQQVQFQLGINYYRRTSQEAGGVLWHCQPRQMNDRERTEYGILAGQLAAICRAVRSADMEKYLAMGLTPNQIFDMASATGIGVSGANEGKHGRPPVWTALKRAETDLYRQLFPTIFQKLAEAQINMDDVILDSEPNGGPDWQVLEALEDDWAVEGIVEYTDEPEPEPPAEPEPEPAKPTLSMKKKFHAIGVEVYGDEWDDKRPELVKAITKGRATSSNDLTRDEMARLIDGMTEKLHHLVPAGEPEPVDVEAINDELFD